MYLEILMGLSINPLGVLNSAKTKNNNIIVRFVRTPLLLDEDSLLRVISKL
jgi:hypothetical protein